MHALSVHMIAKISREKPPADDFVTMATWTKNKEDAYMFLEKPELQVDSETRLECIEV